jgi:hypothetical protein
MTVKFAPEVERPDAPPLETKPQRSGGWFRRLQRRVKFGLAGDDEELIIENKTEISWRVYHNYHQLGIIDAHERQVFRLHKHGSLSVRPYTEGDEVEYLVLSLNYDVTRVHIYRRQMGKDVEVYDMRIV